MRLSQRGIRLYRTIKGAITTPDSHLVKRIILGSVAALAFLVVPLAVQGLSGSDEPKPSPASNSESEDKTPTPAQNSSQTSVDVSTQTSASGAHGSSSTEVSINGQSIPVPPNGHLHKEVTDDGNHTTVDISVEGHQSGSASNHSSTTVEVNGHSADIEDQTDTRGGLRHPNR